MPSTPSGKPVPYRHFLALMEIHPASLPLVLIYSILRSVATASILAIQMFCLVWNPWFRSSAIRCTQATLMS